MKIEVMAKEAIASGMPIALPTSTPTVHESVQEVHENRFTNRARRTDQPPSSNLRVFTP